MKVKNLNGSSDFEKPTCKCNTWIEHWKNNRYGINSNYSSLRCRACGDSVSYLHINGGHVIKVDNFDKNRYIVPICDKCNAKKDLVFNVEEVDLISANCQNCINK